MYVHIPFCKKKCAYCDFNSYERKENLVEEYIESLCKEIKLSTNENECMAGSIFIGGGTPSLIDGKYIDRVLTQIRKNYSLTRDVEISMEANPGTLNREKLQGYMNSGVNRLSIGLQACQDKHLNTLGRIHDYGTFEESYTMARREGFNNINIDLIFGIPGQKMDDWEETLERVVKLRPQHISCYSLKIEEGTPFGKIYNRKDLNITNQYPLLPTEEQERYMYHFTVSYLKENGFRHYEISNFSKAGFECRHNITYWKCEKYLGLGAGAHSYSDLSRTGKHSNLLYRFRNYLKIEKYIDSLGKSNLPRTDIRLIDSGESISEYVIMGLRMIKGINVDEFKERYNVEFEAAFSSQIEKLSKNSLIQKKGRNYCLTELGLDLANQVMMEFL